MHTLCTVAILAQGTTSGQCVSQGLFACLCFLSWSSMKGSRPQLRTPQLWSAASFIASFALQNISTSANAHIMHRSHFGSRYHIWSMRLARPFCLRPSFVLASSPLGCGPAFLWEVGGSKVFAGGFLRKVGESEIRPPICYGRSHSDVRGEFS